MVTAINTSGHIYNIRTYIINDICTCTCTTNFVLTLDQQVQQFLCVDCGLPEVGHEPDEGRVPLVHNLGEGGGARGHEDLAHPVMEPGHAFVVHPQETLRCALFGHLGWTNRKYSSVQFHTTEGCAATCSHMCTACYVCIWATSRISSLNTHNYVYYKTMLTVGINM